MRELFNENVTSIETYIMFKITEKANELREELTAKGREPISLAMGAPTCRPPQFVIDEIKKLVDIDAMHTYSSPKGEKTYLEAVANRMKKRFGVEVNPKTEICSLIGSKEGIANMIRALINPKHDIKDKDIILTPNPSYASYKEMVKVSGGYSYSVPLTPENNFMPDLDEVWDNLIKDGFNPKKVKALLVNYPSNPLGATATLDYYKHAVEFCKKHHILLIGDSAYCDLYYDESKKPHSILEVEGAKDIAVEFFSFSKPYAMTGWRLGWVCGNAEALSYFCKQKTTIDTGIFKAIQNAGANLLNSDEADKYNTWLNNEFKRKRDLFANGLKKLGYEIPIIPDATFYLWVKMPKCYDSSEKFCADLLEKSGIMVVPGEGFGDMGKGYFRVSYVCSDEKLQEVLDRMEKDGFKYN